MAIVSRVIAALLGGYILANLAAVVVAYLYPSTRADGVMMGLYLGFVFYTLAVLWVFSAKTARIAWIGIVTPSLVCAICIALMVPKELF